MIQILASLILILEIKMISVFIRDDWRKLFFCGTYNWIYRRYISNSVAFRNFAKRRLSVANTDVDLRGSTYRRSGFPLKLAALTVRQTFLPPLIQSFPRLTYEVTSARDKDSFFSRKNSKIKKKIGSLLRKKSFLVAFITI